MKTNKNKFLTLILSLTLCSLAQANTAADSLIEFIKIGKNQKTEIFDFIKNQVSIKEELVKKHTGEWADFGSKMVTDIKNDRESSQESKNKIFNNCLNKAVELHEKQLIELNNWRDTEYHKALSLRDKHAQELSRFLEKNIYQ